MYDEGLSHAWNVLYNHIWRMFLMEIKLFPYRTLGWNNNALRIWKNHIYFSSLGSLKLELSEENHKQRKYVFAVFHLHYENTYVGDNLH